MMNLKKALVALSVALPLGGVVAVGAAQAYQQAEQSEKRDLGPSRSQDVPTIEKTYFVGNLYSFRTPQFEQTDGIPPISAERIAEGGRPDLAPLVEMSIAPGTWKTDDAEARDGRIGSITPTADGRYLAIRHTAKNHEQVAALLTNLRTIVKAAIWNAVDLVAPGTSKTPIYVKLPSLPKGGAQAKGVAPIGGNESQSERRKRVRRLLLQLQAELDAMDSEGSGAVQD